MFFAEDRQLPCLHWKLLMGLLLGAGPPCSVGRIDVDVWNCADIATVNHALVQDHVTARFQNLTCPDWTTVVVHDADDERELRIEVLPAPDNVEEEQSPLFLDRVRFDAGRGATIVFAVDVSIFHSDSKTTQPWQGGHDQDVNGGALNVHDSASVIFLRDMTLHNIKVEGSGAGMYITENAIVTIHGRATFKELTSANMGGAVCTTAGGILFAVGGITAINNTAKEGGAIHNLGRITVENGEPEFVGNSALLGAALYNEWGADGVRFYSRALFKNNRTPEGGEESATFSGEHIYSKNYLFFGEGVTFAEGQTAILVGAGLVEIEGPAIFSGFTAGAVRTTYEPFVEHLKLLEPPTFEDNSGGVSNCDDIAYEQLDGSFTCDADEQG